VLPFASITEVASGAFPGRTLLLPPGQPYGQRGTQIENLRKTAQVCGQDVPARRGLSRLVCPIIISGWTNSDGPRWRGFARRKFNYDQLSSVGVRRQGQARRPEDGLVVVGIVMLIIVVACSSSMVNPMQIINSPLEMQQIALAARAAGKRLGVVPTMGFLHVGAFSLVQLAREHRDVFILTLFVNPTQFGPKEDSPSIRATSSATPSSAARPARISSSRRIRPRCMRRMRQLYRRGKAFRAACAACRGPATSAASARWSAKLFKPLPAARRGLRREGRAAAPRHPPHDARPEFPDRDHRRPDHAASRTASP